MSRREKFSRALKRVADAVDVLGLGNNEEEPANLDDSDSEGYAELEKLVGFSGLVFASGSKLGVFQTGQKREDILKKAFGKHTKDLRKLRLNNGDEVWYPKGTSVLGNIASNTMVTTVIISPGEDGSLKNMTRDEYVAYIALHGRLDEDPPLVLPEQRRTSFRAL